MVIMSLLKSTLGLSSQVASVSYRFGTTLVLTKQQLPLTSLALFTTEEKAKNPELVVPKKPLNPYMFFLTEQTPNLKETHPNIKERLSVIGQRWRELEQAQKLIYKLKFASAMHEYTQKIAAIEADPKLNDQLTHFTEEKSKQRAEKAYRKAKRQRMALREDLGRPKRAFLSSYQIFYVENFARLHKKNSRAADTTKTISELWKSLSEEDKKPYIAKYNKFKDDYHIGVEAWKMKMKGNEEKSQSIAKMNKKVTRKRKLQQQRSQVEEDL